MEQLREERKRRSKRLPQNGNTSKKDVKDGTEGLRGKGCPAGKSRRVPEGGASNFNKGEGLKRGK